MLGDDTKDLHTLFEHLREYSRGASPRVASYCAGIVSAVAISSFECTIKYIISARQEMLMDDNHFKKGKIKGKINTGRLNARIKTYNLKEYIEKMTGNDNLVPFLYGDYNHIDDIPENPPQMDKISAAYDNLVEARHQFIHNSVSTLTIDEAIDNFNTARREIERFDNLLIYYCSHD